MPDVPQWWQAIAEDAAHEEGWSTSERDREVLVSGLTAVLADLRRQIQDRRDRVFQHQHTAEGRGATSTAAHYGSEVVAFDIVLDLLDTGGREEVPPTW